METAVPQASQDRMVNFTEQYNNSVRKVGLSFPTISIDITSTVFENTNLNMPIDTIPVP